ncbi:MAG: hypothetical protein HQ504_02895 [Rhodospirillaceae bacterium]|nr:hypothetical protein [Rhodospirillaceae bacterium]
MKTRTLTLTAAAAAIALGAAAFTALPTYAHGPEGSAPNTETGPGSAYMGGHMGGRMGGHMGNGMMGSGGYGHMSNYQQDVDRNLSVDDVRKIVDGMLVMHGNDRLKAGKIEAVDDDTIVAEIVTVDDSLVRKVTFDRKTGSHHRVH